MLHPKSIPTRRLKYLVQPEKSTKKEDSNWARLVQGLLAVIHVSILAFALHFVGVLEEQSYIEALGFNLSLFPKDTYWFELNGLNAFFRWVSNTIAHLNTVSPVVGVAAFMIFPFLVAGIRQIARGLDNRTNLTNIREKTPKFIKELLLDFSLAFLIQYLIFLTILFIFLATALPGSIAERLGRERASRELSEYHQHSDCKLWANGKPCVELRKDDKTLAKGFYVDGTENTAAIFDVARQKVLHLELKGTKLEAQTIFTPKD